GPRCPDNRSLMLSGDSCGHLELARRDADEALEGMGELALIREAGARRDLCHGDVAPSRTPRGHRTERGTREARYHDPVRQGAQDGEAAGSRFLRASSRSIEKMPAPPRVSATRPAMYRRLTSMPGGPNCGPSAVNPMVLMALKP